MWLCRVQNVTVIISKSKFPMKNAPRVINYGVLINLNILNTDHFHFKLNLSKNSILLCINFPLTFEISTYYEGDKKHEETQVLVKKKEEKKDKFRRKFTSKCPLLLSQPSVSAFCSTTATVLWTNPRGQLRGLIELSYILGTSFEFFKWFSICFYFRREWCWSWNKAIASDITCYQYKLFLSAIYASESCLWNACCANNDKRKIFWSFRMYFQRWKASDSRCFSLFSH